MKRIFIGVIGLGMALSVCARTFNMKELGADSKP